MNESFKQMLGIPYLKTIHSLERRDPMRNMRSLRLKPGEEAISFDHQGREHVQTLLSVTAFQTDGRVYKLIAFQ